MAYTVSGHLFWNQRLPEVLSRQRATCIEVKGWLAKNLPPDASSNKLQHLYYCSKCQIYSHHHSQYKSNGYCSTSSLKMEWQWIFYISDYRLFTLVLFMLTSKHKSLVTISMFIPKSTSSTSCLLHRTGDSCTNFEAAKISQHTGSYKVTSISRPSLYALHTWGLKTESEFC